ncbi:rhodanese-like domain-containing protein [Thermoactinomyces mirandus]|uniref:Rhodanese-like domain-containing protein n=1 Tax=Thermoactinomyces mirandus TaxID=2756294 RepID=A0A7W1XRF7_9BACL|nr:rhodanese-like domain-containing protein [Thermoactinomyces mirandus]MBA4601932.1 rhodanese-like domain-containing protein [Thermoactinomyces mirandus]
MDSIYIGLILLAGAILYFFFMNRGIQTIGSDELENIRKKQKILLIDVREKHEFKSGHIPGAINIPLSQKQTLLTKSSDWNKNKPIYLYCQSGSRSGMAARQLRKLGFRQVFHLKGGLLSWNGSIKKGR